MSDQLSAGPIQTSADRRPSKPDESSDETTFEERWKAWQARGAAHDRAVRRKIAVAARWILLVVLAAAALYLLGAR